MLAFYKDYLGLVEICFFSHHDFLNQNWGNILGFNQTFWSRSLCLMATCLPSTNNNLVQIFVPCDNIVAFHKKSGLMTTCLFLPRLCSLNILTCDNILVFHKDFLVNNHCHILAFHQGFADQISNLVAKCSSFIKTFLVQNCGKMLGFLHDFLN